MDREKRIQWLADHAPKIREEEIRVINEEFQPYLFRRNKTRELWTTCCGKHVELEKDHPLLKAQHTKWLPWWAGSKEREKLPPPVQCPVCGKKAILKELGRTGERQNLWSYDRFIILRKGRGCLWGIGVEATKSYADPNNLTALPKISVLKIYRFAPGLAEQISRHWYYAAQGKDFGGYQRLEGTLKSKWKFRDGFDLCKECGQGYKFINSDGLKGTPFQYCQLEKYPSGDKMRYLALASIYPRQVEMMMKAGLTYIVDQMTSGYTNRKVMNWAEPNPVKSFGISRPELMEWIAHGKDVELLAAYKRLKKTGLGISFKELSGLRDYVGHTWLEKITVRMCRTNLTWTRLHNYLEKERLQMDKKKKKHTAPLSMAGWWVDYIDAAEVLGYDLKNDVFLLPKGLIRHHDEATKTAVGVRQAKALVERAEKEGKRLVALCKRYTYAEGDWIILPPLNAEDIVNEGKALKHCVGGYADRHVEGSVTILFLRERKRPTTPRVTIEMRGNTIVQIHGYADERASCEANPKRQDPRVLYKEFLDGWLEWVSAGSKRDKKGRPVLPKKKKEVHAA